MKLQFEPLQPNDFLLLHRWLNTKHVADIWGKYPTLEEVQLKYMKRIESEAVFPYLVFLNQKPIGYIQSYWASKVGGGWWKGIDENTWGMDQFIGELELLSRGIGTQMVRLFSMQLFLNENIQRVIVDPKPDNHPAIRCYQKAGFQKVGLIETPDGEALLMEKWG